MDGGENGAALSRLSPRVPSARGAGLGSLAGRGVGNRNAGLLAAASEPGDNNNTMDGAADLGASLVPLGGMDEMRPAGGRGSDDGAAAMEVADDAFSPSVGTNNYQRGQRYKRLGRMLTGRVAAGRIRWARNCGVALILSVGVVQTACFVVMFILIEQQKEQVMNLTTAGLAAR